MAARKQLTTKPRSGPRLWSGEGVRRSKAFLQGTTAPDTATFGWAPAEGRLSLLDRSRACRGIVRGGLLDLIFERQFSYPCQPWVCNVSDVRVEEHDIGASRTDGTRIADAFDPASLMNLASF